MYISCDLFFALSFPERSHPPRGPRSDNATSHLFTFGTTPAEHAKSPVYLLVVVFLSVCFNSFLVLCSSCFQVTIQNVHIRYEDRVTIPLHPSAFGITPAEHAESTHLVLSVSVFLRVCFNSSLVLCLSYFQVTIRNVHIRYDDRVTIGSHMWGMLSFLSLSSCFFQLFSCFAFVVLSGDNPNVLT